MPIEALTQSEVSFYFPEQVKMPDDIALDGKHGVTPETFTKLAAVSVLELQVKFDAYEIPDELHNHSLVRNAASMITAARILRKLRNYQELADSLFADANIMLRTFYEDVAYISVEGGDALSILNHDGDPNRTIDDSNYLPSVYNLTHSFLEEARRSR